nr:acyltransferase [Leucobacter weissii]
MDYLRGAAAFGIMAYHLASWEHGPQPADTVLGRVGIYGVSVFYILSGLTLQHVYADRMGTIRSVRGFFIRRGFRIFPLLWAVTLLAVALSQQPPDPADLALNLTGLFGFVAWDTYFSPGVWSIGNELVFYAMFPIIALAARRPWSLWVAGAVLGGVYLLFAFGILSASVPLSEQWSHYINPLGQAFLFFLGVLIGRLLGSVRLPRPAAHALLWGGVAAFVLLPTGAEQIDLVTGWNRLAFTALCAALVIAVYKMPVSLPRPLHVPLVTLGHISYAVYLLHPLVHEILERLGADVLPPALLIPLAMALTLAAAYLSYRCLEIPLNRLGRRLSGPGEQPGVPATAGPHG